MLLLIAAVGAVVLARAARDGATSTDRAKETRGVNVTWYLVLSALLFAIGACGVLHTAQPAGDPALPRADAERRQPRAGRVLALRGNEEGQVFALIVMVVAACEVVVGLGLIVAMFRRRMPLTSTRCGAAADERDHVGLARPRVPAGGLLVIAFGWRGDAGPRRRLDRHGRDRRSPLPARSARSLPARPPAERPPAHLLAVDLRLGGRARHPDRHPRRPAVGVHVPGRHRGLDADPPVLGRLHGLRPRATRATSPTSTSSSSRCCCWSSPATSCC